jgi:predicted RND superfamily exporter protein
MSNNILEFYSEDSPVYRSNQVMEESLAGIIPYSISFRGEQDLFKDPVFLEKLLALQQILEGDPLVGKTLSLADFVKEMHVAFNAEGAFESPMPASREAVAQYLLLFSVSGHEEELERLVNQDYSWGNIDVRCNSADSDIIGAHLNAVEGWIHSIFPEEKTSFQVHLTGAAVFAYSTLDDLMGDMIRSIFMAVVIIFIVITLEFRSLRIGLMSMIPNLIPVLLTYGAMGWMGIKLELSTVVVFTISLGIAVDDSIHFLVRFREEFRKHGDHEQAIRNAFQGAGKAIVHTTVILVLGLGVLSLSSLPPTTKFAYLTATTLTSALLADLFVLPACILIFKFKL